MKHLMLGLVLVGAVCASRITAFSEPATPAPDITLNEDTGSTIRLSDLKGKVTLVDFWASWCIPCRTSFPAIDALQKELADKGLKVIAVNVDEDRRNAEQFLATRPHTMTIAFDPKGRAAEAFKLKGMPSSILIDRSGRIRFSHMGYTEKTLAQYRFEILQLLGES
jgi:thiol-disulfide isomerase/thioredoxin